MKLQTKIISITITLFIISIVFLGLIIFSNARSIIEKQTIAQLNSVSEIVSQDINSFVSGQENKLELIATQSELSNEELQNMVKLDDSLFELFVMDEKGIIIASSEVNNVGINKSSESYFTNARNSSYVHEAFYSDVTKKYSFTISAPFHNGVLVGRTELSYFNRITTIRTGLGDSGEILLAFNDNNGNLVYFSERRFSDQSVEIIPLEKASGRPVYNAVVNNEGVYLDQEDYRGEKVIGVAKYVPSLDVGMVTKIDYSEAFAQIYSIQRVILLVILIIVILISLVVFVVTRAISREILSLTGTIEKITKGELDTQLPKSDTIEIKSLTDSLNRILASMKLAILRTQMGKEEMGLGEAIKAKETAENKYQRIVEGLKDDYFFYTHDDKGIFTYLSPSVKNILGYDIEEIKVHYSKYLTDNPINKEVEKYTNLSLKGVIQKPYLVEIYSKDKKRHLLEVKETPIKDNSGKVVAVEGIAKDVTNDKKSEQEVYLLKDFLNETGRLAKVGGWELDVKTGKQKWTEEVYKIHEVGKDFDPNLNKGISFFPPEAKPIINDAVKKAIKYGKEYDLVLPFITAKKNHRIVRAVGKAYRENGKIVKIGGIFQDITEEKKIQDKYKALFEGLNDAIYIHDLEGHFLEVNETACKMLGYKKEELLKIGPDKIDSPKFAKLVPERIKELKNKGSAVFDSVHIAKSGKEIPVQISSRVINYNGKPAIISIARAVKK